MKHLLIIGAGGVSRVATIKSAMTMAKGEAFSKITLASRTKSKCDEIAAFIKERVGVDIATAEVNADDTAAVADLIKEIKADLLLNLALPYQDLTLMDACLKAGIP